MCTLLCYYIIDYDAVVVDSDRSMPSAMRAPKIVPNRAVHEQWTQNTVYVASTILNTW